MPSAASSQSLPQVVEANQALIQALAAHPQFPTQQAQRAGKIFFMHDFASNTSAMFNSIINNTPPPDTPATRGSVPNAAPSSMTAAQKNELEKDAFGRLHGLIHDTTGMEGMMFGEAPGRGVDVGDAVRNAASGLEAATSRS